MSSFAEVFGGEPDGVWYAPGRVNLIGEHTDYNDGFVLPFALAQRTTVTARRSAGPQWTVHSTLTKETVQIDEAAAATPGALAGWSAYVAGVVWAMHEAGHRVAGAELFIDSDVPLGAGLSSSHALECAVLGALTDLSDVDIPVTARPRLVQRSENGYVGAPTGILDQSASILCQAGHALFLDCRDLSNEQVPFDLAAAGLALLVIDTRAPHQHTDGEYAKRRSACEAAARVLGVPALRDVSGEHLDAALAALPDDESRRRVRHVVTENQRVLDTVSLLRAGQLRAIGPLLSASHTSMRDDYEITVPPVDTAVAAALSAGAYGARMTGGGFGGCVLALTDAGAVDEVQQAVRNAFASNGFTEPATFLAVPSQGAGRLA
ncbi:galactokinase [Actinocatenispora thailandica]|uniref:Galactokinase n=1 Tax=Actinocatenispora thailandica TaxID=227318 RepID=A0A7R7HZN6_9ACTN|nr:galactokinase [Actinocatenispora thailandica]BCJ37701.1 galactokinase [Actinocatenispora thailandica]